MKPVQTGMLTGLTEERRGGITYLIWYIVSKCMGT
jgi:hypothetical protein